MSQELEQAVGEAAAEIQRHSARINMKEGRAAVIAGTDQIEPIILKHLSPLFARLSQRITEWEERWSKDASQSESECRARDKRIEELEAKSDSGEVVLDEEEASHQETLRLWQVAKARVEELEAQAGATAEIRMILAKPGLDGMGGGMSWVEKLREIRRVVEFGDAGKSLLAELVELREKWERARGVLGQARAAIARETGIWRRGQEDAVEAIDALLSSSSPGQAPECLSHPGPAGEPLTEEEKSRMGLVDGAWPADAETKGGE